MDNENMTEEEKEKKKKKKPTARDLIRYNTYAKKTMLKGETPLSQNKWMEINAESNK